MEAGRVVPLPAITDWPVGDEAGIWGENSDVGEIIVKR